MILPRFVYLLQHKLKLLHYFVMCLQLATRIPACWRLENITQYDITLEDYATNPAWFAVLIPSFCLSLGLNLFVRFAKKSLSQRCFCLALFIACCLVVVVLHSVNLIAFVSHLCLSQWIEANMTILDPRCETFEVILGVCCRDNGYCQCGLLW